MASETRANEAAEPNRSTLASVARFFDRYVSGWVPLASKAAVFYAAWIAVTYYVGNTTPSEDVATLAGIAYWFGWLFAAATLVGIVVVALTEAADRARIARRHT